MNKRHYEHTLPNIRGSLSNTYVRCSFRNTESFKIMEDLIRECVPDNTPPWNGYDT